MPKARNPHLDNNVLLRLVLKMTRENASTTIHDVTRHLNSHKFSTMTNEGKKEEVWVVIPEDSEKGRWTSTVIGAKLSAIRKQIGDSTALSPEQKKGLLEGLTLQRAHGETRSGLDFGSIAEMIPSCDGTGLEVNRVPGNMTTGNHVTTNGQPAGMVQV